MTAAISDPTSDPAPPIFLIKMYGARIFFFLQEPTGEVVLSSAVYNSSMTALKDIAEVRRHAQDPERYSREVTGNGRFRFRLHGENNTILATSEAYKSEALREERIGWVMSNAPGAAVVDNT